MPPRQPLPGVLQALWSEGMRQRATPHLFSLFREQRFGKKIHEVAEDIGAGFWWSVEVSLNLCAASEELFVLLFCSRSSTVSAHLLVRLESTSSLLG